MAKNLLTFNENLNLSIQHKHTEFCDEFSFLLTIHSQTQQNKSYDVLYKFQCKVLWHLTTKKTL